MGWLTSIIEKPIYAYLAWSLRNIPPPPSPMNTTIALCIGHSRKINGKRDGGAVSVGNVAEWDYNLDLAGRIAGILAESNYHLVPIISDYPGNGYGSAQRWLATHLKEIGATLAVELHFNSSDNPTATGHEWLYWGTSERSRQLASYIDAEIMQQVVGLRGRGLKPLTSKDRGSEFCHLTHCPAVICEPFFGSNATDWQIATTQKDKIARGIANGILEFLD